MNSVEIQSLLTQRIGVRWSEDRLCDLDHFLARGVDARDENALAEFMNGETYFFRYPLYLAVLQARLDHHPKDRPFRVLSAACSSGEEAYSVVFALLDRAVEAGLTLEVVGADVRARAIAAARRAVYGQWSFRNLQPDERARFFEEADGASWRVRERYRATPRFTVRNLLDPVDDVPYDAILLCNATLYMEPQAARRVYEKMGACLRPDGLLLIAPTDPPPGAAWSQTDEYGGWSVFRRAEPQSSAARPAALTAHETIPAHGETGSRDGSLDVSARASVEAKARPAPARPATPVRPQPPRKASPPLSVPAGLSAVGAAANVLWVAWANGSLVSAHDELRQRIFLEPGSALWRFLHGVVLWEQGWLQRAAKEVDRAGIWAADLEDNASVAGLCTAAELKQMIQSWRSRHA